MFRIMRKVTEMRSVDRIGGSSAFGGVPKKPAMTFSGLTSILKARKTEQKKKKSIPKIEIQSENESKELKMEKNVQSELDILTKAQTSSDILARSREGDETLGVTAKATTKANNVGKRSKKQAGTSNGSGNKSQTKPKRPQSDGKPFNEVFGDKVTKPKAGVNSLTADRLFEDKVYLSMLAGSLNSNSKFEDDPRIAVERNVKTTAEEALEFLKSREDFWDQLELGKEQRVKKSKQNAPKVLQSTRLAYFM